MPSLGSCLRLEWEILEKASEVMAENGWELSVACNVGKAMETPAKQ